MRGKISLWAGWFLFAVAIIAVYKTFDNFTDILAGLQAILRLLRPFLYGLVIAFLLLPPAKKLEAQLQKLPYGWLQKRARGLSVLLALLAFLLLLTLVLFWFIPTLYQNLSTFILRLPAQLNQAYLYLVQQFDLEVWMQNLLKQITSKLDMNNILEWLGALNFASYAAGISSLLGQLVDFFLGIILSIYILSDRAAIRANLNRITRLFLSPVHTAELQVLLSRIGNILYSFLYGQATDALFVGVASWLGFWLLQIPNASMLGFFYGLFSLIPYFGAFIGVFTVCIFTLISGGLSKFIIALIFIMVLQQVDANIVNPRIIGNSIGIKPLYVIFGATFFGGLMGIPGMLLGPPIMAILAELLDRYLLTREAGMEVPAAATSSPPSDPPAEPPLS